MSDAISQAYGAQAESEKYEEFLEALLAYLEGKRNNEHEAYVLGLQENFKGHNKWWDKEIPFRQTLWNLYRREHFIWARFFHYHLRDCSWFCKQILPKFKRVSPFAGKLLLIVSAASIRSTGTDLELAMTKFPKIVLGDLRKGGEYLLVMDPPELWETYDELWREILPNSMVFRVSEPTG